MNFSLRSQPSCKKSDYLCGKRGCGEKPWGVRLQVERSSYVNQGTRHMSKETRLAHLAAQLNPRRPQPQLLSDCNRIQPFSLRHHLLSSKPRHVSLPGLGLLDFSRLEHMVGRATFVFSSLALISGLGLTLPSTLFMTHSAPSGQKA